MKANIGLTEEQSKHTADVLSKLLANEFVLFSKYLNAHFNIIGPDFHSAHKYLDDLYHDQLENIDSVAEFIRYLGHYVPANLRSYQELASLTEKYDGPNTSQGYFKDLAEDLESIIIYIRENIDSLADKYNAQGASDFITGLMEKHEKTAWMLRAHFLN